VSEGARCVIADPDSDLIGVLIGALGHNYVDGIQCDFGADARVAEMVALAVRRFGRLDIAFNAVATGDVVAATALCIRYEAAWMVSQARGGSITNLYSVAPIQAEGSGRPSPVPADIAELTRAAAVEFRPATIRVNAVGSRPAEPEESAGDGHGARLVVYLASNEAASISGEVLDAEDPIAMRRHPELARYLSRFPDQAGS
jgi:NAD(P)-dependent dehydrogenase (short-subunit alcohol dehydrogenase family)